MIRGTKSDFTINEDGSVLSENVSGSFSSGTTEALLLYEILVQLQRIASRPPGIYPSED